MRHICIHVSPRQFTPSSSPRYHGDLVVGAISPAIVMHDILKATLILTGEIQMPGSQSRVFARLQQCTQATLSPPLASLLLTSSPHSPQSSSMHNQVESTENCRDVLSLRFFFKHRLMLYYCFYGRWVLLVFGISRAPNDLCQKNAPIWRFVKRCIVLRFILALLQLNLISVSRSPSKQGERLRVVISEPVE